MSVTGALREIHLFPVKSAGGLSPQSAAVGPDGLVGDRSHAVVDAGGEVLAAKRTPRLRELQLGESLDAPRVLVPGGQDLAAFLGVTSAHVVPVAGGARQVEAVHVVTLAQRADPAAGDTSRANLVLDVDALLAPGTVLRIGTAVLEVVGLPRHCGGVFARVATPGALRVGDVVDVVVEEGSGPPG
ncbi:MOSC N-terminal beta barrel domain-containing protein [Kineococcus sp. DHX-1]|uniref:MOSC N-terminal beta barrel domain-containing protein n=1 Tax=Kineococcus sp. DHX-1 TaxID=3349638 RepID=UPI0036D303DF